MSGKAYVSAAGTVPGLLEREGTWTRIFPHWQAAREVEVWTGEGGHGGGDPVMLTQIVEPDGAPADKYLRAADQRDGAWSILTGVAANRAMAENRPVSVDELLNDIPLPSYAAVPTVADPPPGSSEGADKSR